jgi:demethylmenaquinone methyltransferase/2-methoxy-6-polyprenyl-1,4-benzoquinol methylase
MYEHDTVKPFEQSESSKKDQVANMFNQIAGRYDLVNRLLTGGLDVGWRKKAIAELASVKPIRILDVGTGTADVAILTHKELAPAAVHITGIDISEGMLELGRKKLAAQKLEQVISLHTGDSEAINFAEGTFDAITVAFGVRNFADLEKGLLEMLRVLRPGGKVVILEFCRPANPVFRWMCDVYTRYIASGAGKWLAKNEAAYNYLDASIRAFPEGKAFLHILNRLGYTNTYLKPLTLGICTIYCGSKPV